MTDKCNANPNDVEFFLEKLYSYYHVKSQAELSFAINISQKTISNWKTRNAISAVKKTCRKLGIYDKIFNINHESGVDDEMFLALKVKIDIKDESFSEFKQKTAELGLEPLEAIELIITKCLNKRNLKSHIIK